MREYVKDIKQTDKGVDVSLGTGVEKAKCDALAAKCGPGGPGCNSDCCDPGFRENIAGIDVSGADDDVTMHLRGALTAEKVVSVMSRCNCYDEV